MTPKQRAGEAALELIRSDMIVGLGTGSTADCFLIALAGAIASGKLRGIRGVPTSKASEARAMELKIPLTTLAESPHPDVTIDGADEIDPDVNAIKGLGGALLREKIVAQNSKKFYIIADSSKIVQTLGAKGPLPVEVVVFGYEIQANFLKSLGCEPKLRLQKNGAPFITDNSNYIYDCKFPRIDKPRELEQTLMSRAGIAGTGLFIGFAAGAIIATENEVKRLNR